MTQQRVFNLTGFAQFPVIMNATSKASIRLMPRGRCFVPEGYVIDPNWVARNPKTVRVEEVKNEPAPAAEQSMDNTED